MVTQPTTVPHAINKQLVHLHLSARCDIEGYCTLPATNRLLECCTGAFLNEELAPLINHLAAEQRLTGRVRDTALDLCMHTGCLQAQAARRTVACPVRRPLQAIAQIVTLQQIAW